MLRARGYAGTGYRSPEIAARIAAGAWRHQPYEDAGSGGRVDPRTLSIELDRILPPERLLAIDSGHFMGWPAMYIDVPDPQGFVFTQAFQSIGLGLASAIGAAVARPDRLTVAALGDEGALMAAGEIETVGRLGSSRCWSSSTTARPTVPRSTTSVPSASHSTSSPSRHRHRRSGPGRRHRGRHGPAVEDLARSSAGSLTGGGRWSSTPRSSRRSWPSGCPRPSGPTDRTYHRGASPMSVLHDLLTAIGSATST